MVVSVCDVFRALDLASRRGSSAVLVKVYDGSRSYVDVVVEGSPLMGLLPESVLSAVGGLGAVGERFEGWVGALYVSAEVVLVRPTVVVVGFGEVARRVSEVAAAMGYYVASVGHRAEGAFYAGGLEDLGRLVSEGSVVVVANEGGHPSDVDAAELAIRRGAGYVAVLASRRRAALIIRELVRRGVPLSEIKARLRAPAGLDVGAKTAGEIAVSIMAEVVMYLRGGTGRPMTEVKNPYEALGEVEGEDLSKYRCEWRPAKEL
ncbi:MAG: XdhC family protein [Pyrobaculum sp.]